MDAGSAVDLPPRMPDEPAPPFAEPVVLWRLRHPDGDLARATLIPGVPASTLVYFVNDQLERGENFEEWEPAVAQAARVREQLIEDGWRDEGP
jgi:hypothetical protein